MSESESAHPDLGYGARGEPISARTPGPAQPIARPGQFLFISGDRLAPSPQRPRGQLHQRLGQLRPGFGAEPGGQVRPRASGACRGHARPVPTPPGQVSCHPCFTHDKGYGDARTVQKWEVMRNLVGTPHQRDRARGAPGAGGSPAGLSQPRVSPAGALPTPTPSPSSCRPSSCCSTSC